MFNPTISGRMVDARDHVRITTRWLERVAASTFFASFGWVGTTCAASALIAGLLYLVPSLALFAFLIPLLGLGTQTAVAGLSVYSLLVIMRNVAIGLGGVPEPLREAADGIGMTSRQRFRLVEIPLALPMMLAGLRIATVMTIGIASLAAYIGAGGFGVLIFRGIATADNDLIVAGALPTALLALLCDALLRRAERAVRY